VLVRLQDELHGQQRHRNYHRNEELSDTASTDNDQKADQDQLSDPAFINAGVSVRSTNERLHLGYARNRKLGTYMSTPSQK